MVSRCFFKRFFFFCKALPPEKGSPTFSPNFVGFFEFTIFQIDEMNASQSSSVVDLAVQSPILASLSSEHFLTCLTKIQATQNQVW